MNRFFIEKDSIHGEFITVTGENHHHMLNVLRLKSQNEIILCDGDATDYLCRIDDIHADHANCHILEAYASPCEPNLKITLFQGLPKSDKLEHIIQKSVELGVHGIVQVETEFTVVKPKKTDGKEDKKLNRLIKISESAAKQSGRGIIPSVHASVPLKKAIQMAQDFDLVIVAYEKEKETTLKSAIKNFKGANIAVFIGPEGGFSPSEIALFKDAKFELITLGTRILRTETASPAVTALILYELEGAIIK